MLTVTYSLKMVGDAVLDKKSFKGKDADADVDLCC